MKQSNLQFFISYCHEDMRLKEKLLISLKSLIYEFNIDEIWHDGEITAGKNIDKEVLDKLNCSDVILLLVSQYFINSHYCMDVELDKAIKRMNRNECIVVPIILSSCTIPDNLSFSRLKRLPKDGHPISSRKFFQNQNEGCNDVTEGLRKDLKKEFPNSIIKKQSIRRSQKRPKEDIYIELYKNGNLQHISATQELISQIPKYHKAINNFRTMMEQALVKAKQVYTAEYKKYKNTANIVPNNIKLKLFRTFLMDICSYTKIYITDNIGIKVHFRISKDDKYLGLIASTDNDDAEDLSSDWTTLMTAIHIYEGLIYNSYRLKAPLLKSLNPKLNTKGKNDKIWKDYVTFTFPKFHLGQIPLISYSISVHKDYFNVKGDVLKILAYLNLGDTIEKFICDYRDICKNIDRTYDLEEVIKTV